MKKNVLVAAFIFCLGLVVGADPLLDVETRVAEAKTKYGVTGKDVLVAIFDRGVDFTHPDFINADGTTRIEGVLDLTDSSGANSPSNPLHKGTIYTKAQIQDAIAGRSTIAFRDAVGHGTSTTGLCCGNGRASDGKYKGPAENARLLIIKATSDGAVAHDAEPAEAAFWDPSLIPGAVDWAVSRASELRLPLVMLWNFGRVGGDVADGSSVLARKIDATVGAGKPGVVMVTGSGDDGSSPNHASGRIAANQTIDLQMTKSTPAGQSLYANVWFDERDRLEMTIVTPSTQLGPFSPPATERDWIQATVGDVFYAHHGGQVHFSDATDNGMRRIYVRFDGGAGNYTIRLKAITVASGSFEAFLTPASRYLDSNTNGFTSFVSDGMTIWDAAAAQNNIVPNSYVYRVTWTDQSGANHTFAGQGLPGELWKGSSIGPTVDGRLGVDVSAPGDRAISTYAPRSYWATTKGNIINEGSGRYGIAGAVSAAAPQTVGIIALLLEKSPTLTAVDVKRLLQQSARADAFTGAIPNPRFGYGKIDAVAALDALLRR